MMSRVVLTGATGTIGLALMEECIKQNIEVLALVNPESKNARRIPKSNFVSVVECALADLHNFTYEDGEYDVFIHLAWSSTGGDLARNMLMPQALNIQYCLDAVELAKRLGCKTFVGAGSQAEYGRTSEVLTENTQPHPETAYGMAKLCAGQMTRLLCQQLGIKHIWPRILSTYGPGSQPQTIVNYVITCLLKGESPKLTGCEQIWDFIYVGDAARALLLLADKGLSDQIYVIGAGKSRALKEYIEDIKAVIEETEGKKLPEIGYGEKSYLSTTVMSLASDISKLKNDTGFVPEVSFYEGIKKTVTWCKQII